MLIQAFLVGLAVAALAVAQPSPIFKSDVSLVEVDVGVQRKGTGEPISDLTLSDFLVIQDGHEQKLTACDFAMTPIDLVVLADVSGSVVQEVRRLASLAERILARSLKRDDRIAIVTFSSNIKVVSSWTSDHERALAGLQNALDRVSRVESGTRLFEAVSRAASLFDVPRPTGRRRAILVLSDDKDGKQKPSEAQTLAAVLEADATVFGVLLPSSEAWQHSQKNVVLLPIPGVPPLVSDKISGRSQRSYRSIARIVEESGGDLIVTARDEEALVTALDRIRLRYLLAYYPNPSIRPGQTVLVQIKLSTEATVQHSDALVRHRTVVTAPNR